MAFRKAITIDNTKVGGSSSLTNFPILVSLTDLDLRTTANGGKVESVNGFDIVFKQGCTTTNLDHEIEQYDPVTGTLVAWVRAPVLFHDTDTLIEMYYGDSAIVSSQENVAGVWDTNYIGVWHLNQPSGAGAYVTNSAQNDHHGTPTNTTFNATGQIDGARTFVDSGDERIDWGNSSSFFDGWNQFAFEFWIFPDYASDAAWEGAAEDGVMSSSSGTAPVRLARVRRGGGEPAGKGTFQADVEFVGAGTQFQTVEISRGQWNHIVYLYDGTDLKKFVNGVSVGSVSLPGDTLVSSSSIGLRLGRTSNALNGSLDEVRISNSGRGDGWIQTEYNNQSSPADVLYGGTRAHGSRLYHQLPFHRNGRGRNRRHRHRYQWLESRDRFGYGLENEQPRDRRSDRSRWRRLHDPVGGFRHQAHTDRALQRGVLGRVYHRAPVYDDPAVGELYLFGRVPRRISFPTGYCQPRRRQSDGARDRL